MKRDVSIIFDNVTIESFMPGLFEGTLNVCHPYLEEFNNLGALVSEET